LCCSSSSCIFIGLCIILAIWYRLHALSDAICVPTPSLSAYSIGASSARLIVLVMPWPGSSRTHSSSWLPPCLWPAGRYIPDPMSLFVGWCTGWPGLFLCAAGALPSVYTRCLQFMRNALVFGDVWHAWTVASGTHAGSGPATPVAEVSDGSRKNLSGVCPDTAAAHSRCRPSISRCC
jgi:hypothetical protein